MNEYFPGDNLFTPFERRRGLPIGNLTSQFFSNLYLQMSGPRALIEGVFGGRFPRDFGELGGIRGCARLTLAWTAGASPAERKV